MGFKLSNLKAGLIGLGHMGSYHARILSNLPGVDFVGVYDKFIASKKNELNCSVVSSLDELIDLDIDYAIIAAPTQNHYEIGAYLAHSGVHALIEKPLCHDSKRSKELANLFNNAGLIGAVGYIERYNPAVKEAKKRMSQLGKLYQVITRRQSPVPERIKDVGVIKDLLTHDIDLTAWLVGQEYTSVFAHTVSSLGREHEDMATVLGTLSDGLISNHLVNWLNPYKERIIILHGEKGVFIINTLTSDLTFYPQESCCLVDNEKTCHFNSLKIDIDPIYFDYPKVNPLLKEHENFRDALLGKDADIITLEQGTKTVFVTEAILDSVKNRKAVSF